MDPSTLSRLTDDDLYHVCEQMTDKQLGRFTQTSKRASRVCYQVLQDRKSEYASEVYMKPEFLSKIIRDLHKEKSVNLVFIRRETGERFRISIQPKKESLSINFRLADTTLEPETSVIESLNNQWAESVIVMPLSRETFPMGKTILFRTKAGNYFY